MPVFSFWSAVADKQQDLPAVLKAEEREDALARQAGRPVEFHWHPDLDSWRPAALFNAMVSPATPFAIKGVIWYQGETNSNLGRVSLYQKVFSTLINDWRSQWRQSNFPFLYVQISSFASGLSESWGAFRDQQRRTLDLTNTAMAVSLDVGDPKNVHPSDKQTVAARLASSGRSCARPWRGRRVLGPAFPSGGCGRRGPARMVRSHWRKAGFEAAHSGRIRSRGRRSPFRRRHRPRRGQHDFRQQSAGRAAPLCALRLGQRTGGHGLQRRGPARIDLHFRVLKGCSFTGSGKMRGHCGFERTNF